MKILNLLSITQAALVFDNFDHLDNLGVNFDSDYSLLDRYNYKELYPVKHLRYYTFGVTSAGPTIFLINAQKCHIKVSKFPP